MSVDIRDVSSAALIASTLESMEPLASAMPIALVVDVPEPLPRMSATAEWSYS